MRLSLSNLKQTIFEFRPVVGRKTDLESVKAIL